VVQVAAVKPGARQSGDDRGSNVVGTGGTVIRIVADERGPRGFLFFLNYQNWLKFEN
jgi:hypothetical protein